MADSTLVQGAGLVAQTERAGNLAASQALTQAGQFIAEGTAITIKRNNREFNKNLKAIMKAELQREPGMSEAEYSSLYKKLKKKRFAYVYLNKKDQVLAKRQILEMKNELDKIENGKKDLAGTIDANNLGNNPAEKLGINGDDITGIVDGSKKPVEKDGKQGYMITNPDLDKYKNMTFSQAFKANRDANIKAHGMDYSKWTSFYWPGSRSDKPDGILTEYHPYRGSDLKKGATKGGFVPVEKELFQTIDQVNDRVNDLKVDEASVQTVQGLMDSVIEKASNLKPGQNSEFNFTSMYNNIRTNVVGKGNLKSLMNDEIVPGRVFKDDLKEALENQTYEQLGIDPEVIARLDPTDNGKITKRDARRIFKAIEEDENLTKDFISEYLTKFIQQQHNNSLTDDVKNYKPPKKKDEKVEKKDEEKKSDEKKSDEKKVDKEEEGSTSDFESNYKDELFNKYNEDEGLLTLERDQVERIYKVNSGQMSIPTIDPLPGRGSDGSQTLADRLGDEGAKTLVETYGEKLKGFGFELKNDGQKFLTIVAPDLTEKTFEYDFFSAQSEVKAREAMNAFIKQKFPGEKVELKSDYDGGEI